MVGFEVTPTTCRSRISRASEPEASRARERSSSQTATPAADSSCNRSVSNLSVICCASLVCPFGSASGRRSLDLARAGQRRARGGHHAVGGEPELLEDHLVGRAGAEVLQAHT